MLCKVEQKSELVCTSEESKTLPQNYVETIHEDMQTRQQKSKNHIQIAKVVVHEGETAESVHNGQDLNRKSVHEIESRFSCQQCEKSYKHVHHLSHHKRIAHEGHRNKCEFC